MFDFPAGRWEGIESISSQALLEEVKPQAERRLVQAGAYFAGEIKLTLTGQRSGRIYRVPGTRNRTYTASAPGEPPAVLFGNLRNSIGASPPVWDGFTVSLEVGVGLGQPPRGGVDPGNSYARILEFGGVTRTGTRILPRPYLEPTAIRAEPEIERILAAA